MSVPNGIWGVAIGVGIGVLLIPLVTGVLEEGMIWQDIVLMIAGFIFAPALIVSIVKRVKYPLLTTLPTVLALTAIVVTYKL